MAESKKLCDTDVGRKIITIFSAIWSFVFTFCCFFVTICLLPILLIVLLTFKVYKQITGFILKRQVEGFKGFLNGEDIVWACEDTFSKSIINAVIYVNARPQDNNENVPEKLLDSLRTQMYKNLMVKTVQTPGSSELTVPHPKMLYTRQKTSAGYFYWTEENKLTIDDFVGFMDDFNDADIMTEYEFKQSVCVISNNPLPGNNTALWETLVCRKKVLTENGIKYPFIFRFHHSLGDGVAILRLFREAIGDKEESDSNEIPNPIPQTFLMRFKRILMNILAIFGAPAALVKMFIRPIDSNQINPKVLSGRKIVNWLYESDNDNNAPLLSTVKLLRRRFNGARFSNILLSAVSKSLQDFLERKNCKVPKNMTVVIPARMYDPNEKFSLKIENKFSVAMQTIPIDVNTTIDRLSKIKHYSDKLKASPDYQVIYWSMSYITGVFPESIFKILFKKKHCTISVSNIPGPNSTIKIDKFELENVGFFLPNIGSTACGITLLSYNGKFHFGIMADIVAIDNEEDLSEILKGIVNEINVMAVVYLNGEHL